MNEHLVCPHPAPLTPAGVAQLHADATNWRALLIELDERGFDNMTLEAIIAVFPDFRGKAGLRACVDGGGPHMAAQPGGATTPSRRQGAPDPPIIPESAATTIWSGPDRPNDGAPAGETVVVDEFAEVATTFGAVLVGYTEDDMLTFHFVRTNRTYLVPLSDILAPITAALRGRPDGAPARTATPTPNRRRSTSCVM
jgi:hypothetical protein